MNTNMYLSRPVAIYIVVSVVVTFAVVAFVAHIVQVNQKPKGKSLYDRLGGVFAIAAVVDHFSDAVIQNPLVGKDSPNPFLKDWSLNHLDRLPGLKFMRTLWVCSVAGGPFKYSPTKAGKCPFSLEKAHDKLEISPAEFDEVAKELANSLDHFKVPALEKGQVLAAFAAHKQEVVAGYDLAHGVTPKAVKC